MGRVFKAEEAGSAALHSCVRATRFLIRCNDNSLSLETRDSRSDLDVSHGLLVALM